MKEYGVIFELWTANCEHPSQYAKSVMAYSFNEAADQIQHKHENEICSVKVLCVELLNE